MKGHRRPGEEKRGKNGKDAKRSRGAGKWQSGGAQEAVRRVMHGNGWRIRREVGERGGEREENRGESGRE